MPGKPIPPAWNIAATTFIPKEKASCSICQFRGIALLNEEGKIFFSVVAKHITGYWVSWLCGTFCHDLGTNPDSQMQQIRSPPNLDGPCKCLRVCSPPDHFLCTELFPHTIKFPEVSSKQLQQLLCLLHNTGYLNMLASASAPLLSFPC